MPVDEASREPSLVRSREDLLAAVRRHDVDAVMKALDPNIRVSFGGGAGVKDFRREWKIDQPDSPLWSELERILTLGGTFQGGDRQRFWAPYVYGAWSDLAPDVFQSEAVIADDIPLHSTGVRASPAIATLSWDIVTLLANGRIRTADGREGWVDPRYLRSPVGYRAGFVRSGTTWRIEALVAGD